MKTEKQIEKELREYMNVWNVHASTALGGLMACYYERDLSKEEISEAVDWFAMEITDNYFERREMMEERLREGMPIHNFRSCRRFDEEEGKIDQSI